MASTYPIFDVSGAVQAATNWLLKQANEIYSSENMRYDVELGSATRRPGYSAFKTLATNKFPQGFFEAKFPDKLYIMFAYNNAGNTATVLSAYDPILDTVTVVKNDYPVNTKLQMVMNAQEMYVAGITTDTGARQTIINVTSALAVSTSRNLFGAPKAAFIGENSGVLYAMNVELNGNVYPDRAYISSPQRGAVTYVNAAMNNTYAPVDLITQTPAMTSATAPSGSVTSSGISPAGEENWKAFDRSASTFATYGGASGGTLTYDFGAGNSKVINFYSINGYRSGIPERSPKTWTLEGSPDNTVWTTLDTQTSVPAWSSGEVRTYKTSNTTAYRYYRLNVTAIQAGGTYNDALNIVEFSLMSSVQTNFEMQIKVDTARYVKPGLPIEIYKAGTNTLLYTITPTSVDNSKDTFNFLPFSTNVLSVNTTTDTITMTSTTNFPTGQPIVFTSTGTVPGGLTSGTTYYAINTGSTTIKLAGSLSDAKIGSAIDLTSTGTGTITGTMSYQLAKTDELWLVGRKGDKVPTILWNTDYRTPQTADFIFIASGKVADTAITGWAKSNNRLNIFTRTSTWQYDNANFLPVFEDIGCISHDTICNNGTWIIWLDATAKVRARDSNSGQDQIISRSMKNKYLNVLAQANLLQSSAVMFDSNYKLDIGQVTVGTQTKFIRLVYNFDMNNWWVESHKRRHVYGLNSSFSGTRKSYFLDENGKMYLDEDGDLDDTDTIPWFIHYGRRNFGNTFMKSLLGLYVHQEAASGSVVEVKLPGDNTTWQNVGQLKDKITRLEIPATKQLDARDFDFKISGNQKGKAAQIDGIEVWYDNKQTNF